jgi:uncharacterized protein (DUF1330 family)
MENEMSVYAIAHIRRIMDPAIFAAYRTAAAEALAKHGGRVAQALPGPTRLEGDLEIPQMLALLEFPDWKAANSWHADPALADIHTLRTNGADITIFAGTGD